MAVKDPLVMMLEEQRRLGMDQAAGEALSPERRSEARNQIFNPAPITFGEKASVAVTAGTQQVASDISAFKSIFQTISGDTEGAEASMNWSEILDQSYSAALEPFGTFEQFLDQPTWSGFIDQVIKGVGMTTPQAIFSVGTGGTGLWAGMIGKAALTHVGKNYTRRKLIEIQKKKLRGDFVTKAEDDMLETAFQGIRAAKYGRKGKVVQTAAAQKEAAAAYSASRAAGLNLPTLGFWSGSFAQGEIVGAAQSFKEYKEAGYELTQDEAWAALALGLPQAALDVLGEKFFYDMVLKNAAGDLVKAPAARAVLNKAKKRGASSLTKAENALLAKAVGKQPAGQFILDIAKAGLTGFAKSGISEGITETLQEEILIQQRKNIDPTFTDAEANLRRAESAFVGFFAGAARGAPGGVISEAYKLLNDGNEVAANLKNEILEFQSPGYSGDIVANPVKESPGDIKAQINDLFNPDSPRKIVLITESDKSKALDMLVGIPEEQMGAIQARETNGGVVLVNTADPESVAEGNRLLKLDLADGEVLADALGFSEVQKPEHERVVVVKDEEGAILFRHTIGNSQEAKNLAVANAQARYPGKTVTVQDKKAAIQESVATLEEGKIDDSTKPEAKAKKIDPSDTADGAQATDPQDLATLEVGDEIDVYNAKGERYKAKVTAVSAKGSVRVINQAGKNVLLGGLSATTLNASNPNFLITIGGSQFAKFRGKKIKDLTDAELVAFIKELENLLADKRNLSPNDARINLNAVKIEQTRRKNKGPGKAKPKAKATQPAVEDMTQEDFEAMLDDIENAPPTLETRDMAEPVTSPDDPRTRKKTVEEEFIQDAPEETVIGSKSFVGPVAPTIPGRQVRLTLDRTGPSFFERYLNAQAEQGSKKDKVESSSLEDRMTQILNAIVNKAVYPDDERRRDIKEAQANLYKRELNTPKRLESLGETMKGMTEVQKQVAETQTKRFFGQSFNELVETVFGTSALENIDFDAYEFDQNEKTAAQLERQAEDYSEAVIQIVKEGGYILGKDKQPKLVYKASQYGSKAAREQQTPTEEQIKEAAKIIYPDLNQADARAALLSFDPAVGTLNAVIKFNKEDPSGLIEIVDVGQDEKPFLSTFKNPDGVPANALWVVRTKKGAELRNAIIKAAESALINPKLNKDKSKIPRFNTQTVIINKNPDIDPKLGPAYANGINITSLLNYIIDRDKGTEQEISLTLPIESRYTLALGTLIEEMSTMNPPLTLTYGFPETDKRSAESPEMEVFAFINKYIKEQENRRAQKRAARKEGAEPTEPTQTTQGRVELPGQSRYKAKDQAKSDKANKFIGIGATGSSTAKYQAAWGERANTGIYSESDVVFISVNGRRKDRAKFNQQELQLALDAGATIITDNRADRTRSYNIGEREVAEFLTNNNYSENNGDGVWTSPQTTQPAQPTQPTEPETGNFPLLIGQYQKDGKNYKEKTKKVDGKIKPDRVILNEKALQKTARPNVGRKVNNFNKALRRAFEENEKTGGIPRGTPPVKIGGIPLSYDSSTAFVVLFNKIFNGDLFNEFLARRANPYSTETFEDPSQTIKAFKEYLNAPLSKAARFAAMDLVLTGMPADTAMRFERMFQNYTEAQQTALFEVYLSQKNLEIENSKKQEDKGIIELTNEKYALTGNVNDPDAVDRAIKEEFGAANPEIVDADYESDFEPDADKLLRTNIEQIATNESKQLGEYIDPLPLTRLNVDTKPELNKPFISSLQKGRGEGPLEKKRKAKITIGAGVTSALENSRFKRSLGPLKYASAFKILFRSLGYKREMQVLTPDEMRALMDKGGFNSEFEVEGEVKSAKNGILDILENMQNSSEYAKYIRLNDVDFIILDPDMINSAFPTALQSYTTLVYSLGHEMGHAFFVDQMQNSLIFKKQREMLMNAFQKDRERLQAAGSAKYDGPLGFEEWFADKTAAWLVGTVTKARAKNATDGFFKRLAQKIIETFMFVNKTFFNNRFKPSADFDAFAQEVLNKVNQRNFGTLSEPRKKAGTRVPTDTTLKSVSSMSAASRAELGLSYKEEFIVRDLADEVSKEHKKYMPETKAQWFKNQIIRILKARFPGTPEDQSHWSVNYLFRPADGYLRSLGGAAKDIAILLYSRSSSQDAMGYLNLRTAAVNQKLNNFYDLQDPSGKYIYRDSKGELNIELIQQAALEAESSKATGSLPPPAKAMREFLEDFHKSYIDPADPGKIEFLKNFFPRRWLKSELANDPEKRKQLAALLRKYNPKVKRIKKPNTEFEHYENWEEFVDAWVLLDEDSDSNGLQVDDSDSISALAIGMSRSRQKFFKNIPTEAARHGLDLNGNVMEEGDVGLLAQADYAIKSYIEDMVKKIEYEAKVVVTPTNKDRDNLENLYGVATANKILGTGQEFAENYPKLKGWQAMEVLLARIEDPSDRKGARVAVESMLGKVGQNMSPFARKLNSGLLFGNMVTLLTFAAVASLPDVAGPILRSRDMNNKLGTIVEQLKYTIKNKQQAEQFARDLGVVTHDSIETMYINAAELGFMTDKTKQWSRSFFRITLLEQFTKFTRVFAAGMGEQYLIRTAEQAQQGDKVALRHLQELNKELTPKDVLVWASTNKEGRRDFTTDSGKKVQMAVARFVEESIVRPNAAERPVWASNPYFALVWQLKSFFYAFGKNIVGGAIREGRNKYKEDGKLTSRVIPLLIGAGLLLPLTAIGLELREFIKYLGRSAVGDQEGAARAFRSDEMAWGLYMLELLDRSGIFGPFGLIFPMAQASKYGDPFILPWLGPTAERAYTLSIDRTFNTKEYLPVIAPIL